MDTDRPSDGTTVDAGSLTWLLRSAMRCADNEGHLAAIRLRVSPGSIIAEATNRYVYGSFTAPTWGGGDTFEDMLSLSEAKMAIKALKGRKGRTIIRFHDYTIMADGEAITTASHYTRLPALTDIERMFAPAQLPLPVSYSAYTIGLLGAIKLPGDEDTRWTVTNGIPGKMSRAVTQVSEKSGCSAQLFIMPVR